MQWVEEETISQINASQPAPLPTQALSATMTTREGVSFPHEAEATVEEELEQKSDDCLKCPTNPGNLQATRKIESAGVNRSAEKVDLSELAPHAKPFFLSLRRSFFVIVILIVW